MPTIILDLRRTAALLAAVGGVILTVTTNVVSAGVVRPSAHVVHTTQGPVGGLEIDTAHGPVAAYLGVPYARAPVGKLRFELPQPPLFSERIYNATAKGPSCPQVPMAIGDLRLDFGEQDEDCLYLNIWTPRNASKLPVVVYIHGGAFTTGSGSFFMFDGTRLAAQMNVVYVTINMRLGPFGFLQIPDVVQPNLGLHDIVEALRWLNRNADRFGGNPSKVTAWGQSAGAIAVDFLLKSPQQVVKGLVHRAVLQGGSAATSSALFASDGETASQNLAYSLGCFSDKSWQDDTKSIVACLKKTSWKEIVQVLSERNAIESSSIQPFVDEVIVSADIAGSSRIESSVKEVFVLTDQDEGFVFMSALFMRLYQTSTVSTDDWLTPLLVMFKFVFHMPFRVTYKLIDVYVPGHVNGELSVGPEKEVRLQRAISQMFTDSIFRCPGDHRAGTAATHGVRAYRGEFHFRPSFSYLPSWATMSHADEIAYLHGNLEDYRPGRPEMSEMMLAGFANVSAEDQPFSREAMNILAEFFHGRKPRIPGSQQEWPLYSAEDPQIVYMAPNNFTVVRGLKTDKCALWEPYILSKSKSENVSPKVTTTTMTPSTSAPSQGVAVGTDDDNKEANVIRRGKTLRRTYERIESAAPALVAPSQQLIALVSLALLFVAGPLLVNVGRQSV